MRQPIPAAELHSVLSQAHNDLYKEINGIRPRWLRYDEMSTPELEARMLSLMAEAVEAQDDFDSRLEANREAVRVEALRAHEERFRDAAAVCGALGW